MDVYAIFVANMIFLPFIPFLLGFGGASKILCCWWGGKVEYNGITDTGPTLSPSYLISYLIF